MNTVYVFDNAGKPRAHGPARASLKQANAVAASLSRRLGWVCVVADAPPPDRSPLADGPTATEAATSPVWKIPALAARWGSGARAQRPATVPVAPAPVSEKFADDARLAAIGLVLG